MPADLLNKIALHLRSNKRNSCKEREVFLESASDSKTITCERTRIDSTCIRIRGRASSRKMEEIERHTESPRVTGSCLWTFRLAYL